MQRQEVPSKTSRKTSPKSPCRHGDKTHLYNHIFNQMDQKKLRILVQSPQQLDRMIDKMHQQQKKDVNIIHSSQFKILSPKEQIQPLLTSPNNSVIHVKSTRNNASTGRNVHNCSQSMTPYAGVPSASTAFESGAVNLPYEYLIMTKQEPEAEFQRQMGIHSRKAMRKRIKMKQQRFSQIRNQQINESLGVHNKRSVLIADPSLSQSSQGKAENHLAKNRLSQRVQLQNQTLNTPYSLNDHNTSIASQEQLPSIERTDLTKQMWNEAMISARSNEMEYLQKLHRIHRLSKKLNPSLGRDHHIGDKASLISSGNVSNLVVFKNNKQSLVSNRNQSLRQIELLNMHDKESKLLKKKLEAKKSIVKKYNRNLILQARDEALQLKKYEILSPILRRNNQKSKEHFASMDQQSPLKNSGINLIFPENKKSELKNKSKEKKKKSQKDSPFRNSTTSLNKAELQKTFISQTSYNESQNATKTDLNAKKEAVKILENDQSDQVETIPKKYSFMDKLDKIIMNNMQGQINLKNQQYSRKYINNTQKMMKNPKQSLKEEYKQKNSAQANMTPKITKDQDKNKLFLSQQHLESMLSKHRHDRNSFNNHHQSVSFLPNQDSFNSCLDDGQKFRHFGSLPKIDSVQTGLLASANRIFSPTPFKQNKYNIIQGSHLQKNILGDDSILSSQEPLIQITNVNKYNQAQQMTNDQIKQRGAVGKSVNISDQIKINEMVKTVEGQFQATQEGTLTKTSSVSVINPILQARFGGNKSPQKQFLQKSLKPFPGGTSSIQILSGSLDSQKFAETQNDHGSDAIGAEDKQNNIKKTFDLIRDFDFEIQKDMLHYQGYNSTPHSIEESHQMVDRQRSPQLYQNLSSMLSQEILKKQMQSPEKSHYEHFSHMTDIENQFLELTQDILLQGQSKIVLQPYENKKGDLAENDGDDQDVAQSSNGYDMMLLQDQSRDILKERFTQADYEIKKSYQQLKNLLQNDKNIYEYIAVPEVALPSKAKKQNGDLVLKAYTNISLLKNLQYFYRVDCPLEKDPETQKLQLCSPTIFIEGNITNCNLQIYGSFAHKLPGPKEHLKVVEPKKAKRSKRVIVEKEQNYQMFLENQKKFTIPADYGQMMINSLNNNNKKNDEGSPDMSRRPLNVYDKIPFYICMITDDDNGIKLKIKTTIKLNSSTVASLRQKEKKLQFLQRSSISSGDDIKGSHSRSRNQMQQLALTEKYRQDIRSGAMSRDQCEDIIDKMKVLMKRKRIADFLKNQFGTNNKYLQEVSQKDLYSENQQQVKISFRDLNQKILENIQMQGVKGTELSRYFHGQSWQHKMSKAISKRNELEQEKRIKVIQDQGKWDQFRLRKDQAIQRYINVKKQQAILSRFVKTIFFDKCVRLAGRHLFKRVYQIKTRRKIIFFLKICIDTYRRRMKKLGSTLQIRNKNQMKCTILSQAMLTHQAAKKQAMRKHLLPFLLQYQYRDAIKQKFRHMIHRILFIQHRFRQNQSANEAKLNALINAWDKEVSEMRKKIKSNTKQPGLKKLVDQLTKVPLDIKEACLRRYLAACKYKHALAFFQWRKQYSNQESTLLKAIFQSRMQILQMKQDMRERMMLDLKSENQSDKRSQEVSLRDERSSMANSQISLDNSLVRPHRDEMKWRSSGISKDDIRDDLAMNNIIRIKRLQTKMIYLRDEKFLSEQPNDENAEQIHLIKSFEEINLVDPFPPKQNKESKKGLKGRPSKMISARGSSMLGTIQSGGYEISDSAQGDDKIDQLVYDAKKFHPEEPPTLIFIPSKVILKKMMRLCTQVNNYNEIFYYF